ncbi:hypothetical protein [Streptomyces omiyaensis]|uniref:Uncharacterized protein n=1 Tax=Streptomyces omiyaensis TaxID=68247 RepID=A0ABW7BWR6_9ACTN|nr:hypothetical protein [Streptomyces omiyaensis]GGY66224.1 hypothetical protein GCM10010363_54390 [Streptomyces omiyaensis]
MRDERLDEPLSDEELELFVPYPHRFAHHDVEEGSVGLVLERSGEEEWPGSLRLSWEWTSGTDVHDGG